MTTVRRLVAFTCDPKDGNPTAIVLTSRDPPHDEMQRISAEVGYSDTAILTPAVEAVCSYWVRYSAVWSRFLSADTRPSPRASSWLGATGRARFSLRPTPGR